MSICAWCGQVGDVRPQGPGGLCFTCATWAEKSQPQLMMAVQVENRRLDLAHGAGVSIQLPRVTVLALVALVQLALRHPGNQGETAKEGRLWVMEVVRQVFADAPAHRELIRRGFDARFDV